MIVGNSGGNGCANTVLAGSATVGVVVAVQCGNGPQALINRADIKVDFNFVILYITILPHLSVYLFVTRGSRLYLKSSLKLIILLRPITV